MGRWGYELRWQVLQWRMELASRTYGLSPLGLELDWFAFLLCLSPPFSALWTPLLLLHICKGADLCCSWADRWAGSLLGSSQSLLLACIGAFAGNLCQAWHWGPWLSLCFIQPCSLINWDSSAMTETGPILEIISSLHAEETKPLFPSSLYVTR